MENGLHADEQHMKPDQYHIAALLGRYLRGDLSEEEESVLHKWLSESEANQRLLESFRNDSEGAQRDVDFIEGLNPEVAWNTFARRIEHRKKQVFRHYLKYVAAILILVTVAWLWVGLDRMSDDDTLVVQTDNVFYNDVDPGGNRAQLKLSDGRTVDLETYLSGLQEQDGTMIKGGDGQLAYSTPEKGVTELIYNTLVIPKAGTYQLTLSDGTKVWLNAMSELRFPVQFGHHERKVFLKGEAYFEVMRDTDRPFRVAVDNTEVEVLGTHFNINSYAGVTTTLVEGSVKVHHQEEEQLLSPGQEAKVGDRIAVYQANLEKVIAWKNGDFYFKSDNMVQIMEQLARWYDIDVIYKGHVPLHTGYNGSISRNVNLSEVLEMLTFASGARFSIQQKSVSVIFNN